MAVDSLKITALDVRLAVFQFPATIWGVNTLLYKVSIPLSCYLIYQYTKALVIKAPLSINVFLYTETLAHSYVIRHIICENKIDIKHTVFYFRDNFRYS